MGYTCQSTERIYGNTGKSILKYSKLANLWSNGRDVMMRINGFVKLNSNYTYITYSLNYTYR